MTRDRAHEESRIFNDTWKVNLHDELWSGYKVNEGTELRGNKGSSMILGKLTFIISSGQDISSMR